MNECVLPDPAGFFEIRFESIGGLGAHAAGQILARAAVLKMNHNGLEADFEKSGWVRQYTFVHQRAPESIGFRSE